MGLNPIEGSNPSLSVTIRPPAVTTVGGVVYFTPDPAPQPYRPRFDPDGLPGPRRVNLYPYIPAHSDATPFGKAGRAAVLQRLLPVSTQHGAIERTTPRRSAVRLTTEEVHEAFEPLAMQYPPILSLTQAAELAGLKPSTLKRKVS
ncbi:MAG: hypothetical protein JWP03_2271, partial [Phycisphaerales bacterium]|nr:hypothetical protein [Phycisphaerales bacterium]